MEMNYEQRIKELATIVKYSGSTVFFGGAGVSTESGIPDFRSKNGLYNQKDVNFENYTPEYLLNVCCLNSEPEVFFEFYKQKLNTFDILPNKAHEVLAKLEERELIDAVITQNIDNLHQKAGSKNVLEIHGTTYRNYCNRCGKLYPATYIMDSTETVPKCECGGVVRPDVTLYGENLPNAFNEAGTYVMSAQTLIVGGTSLNVYPAANLVRDFDHRNKNLIVINNQITNADRYAKLVFRENIGKVFGDLWTEIQ